jgi:hypothetical protein
MIALTLAVLLAQSGDAEFLRRATLDLGGTIPTSDQARAFLADPDPVKREKLIDRLLASPDYARRMEQAITVMFLERRSGGKIPDAQWSDYLVKAFAANEPWDRIVRSMIATDGRVDDTRPAMKLLADGAGGDPNRMTNDVARLFLGRNLLCAQCHDHPSVREYKQAEYMGLFAFLRGSKLQDDPKTKKPLLAEIATTGKVEFASVFSTAKKHQTGPRLFGGDELEIATGKVRSRELLADALIRHPQFARNSVNRFWFIFMGKGLIHPLDYDHKANPPSDPALLESLTAGFVESGFDLRKLVRRIVTSPAYAGSPSKPLSAEQMAMATLTATGNLERLRAEPAKFNVKNYLNGKDPTPPGSLPEILKLFVAIFGNAEGEPEIGFQPSMTHALFLMNDRLVLEWLKPAPGNLVHRLSKLSGDAVADELYLSILTRMPVAAERKEVAAYKGNVADLAWALIASTEFRMNH